MKNGSGTYYYRERRKRYDGVWVDDVAKCGVFGDLDPQAFSTEPFPIPKLELLEPLQVLESAARDLHLARQAADNAKAAATLEGGA